MHASLKTLPGVSASYDFRDKQYVIAVWSGADACGLATSNTSRAIAGVVQNDPNSGDALTVAYEGVTKIKAGAAITANALITTNASGRAAAVASGASTTVIGRALEAASADGDEITALLFGTHVSNDGLAV
jgi:hypothetical protein